MFLALFQVAKAAFDLWQPGHFLEMIVQVVQGIPQVGVHDALLELGKRHDHQVVGKGRLITATEPLLRLQLIIHDLEILF